MNMTGIEDFHMPQHLNISHPENGFFGYMLRCRCHVDEDVSGNFVFLADGIDCCMRFPSARRQREVLRTEWNGHIDNYLGAFRGQLYYVNEHIIEPFIDSMTGGSIDAVRLFLRKLMEGIRETAPYNNIPGLEPLYAVSHVCQLTDAGRMHWPHIHVLWGIKRD